MVLSSLFKKVYFPLNTIEISQQNVVFNYKYVCKLSALQIAPVLKSNAYGHGIVQIAKILDGVGVPFFCVDSIYEGYQLLKAKIHTPILIMGYIQPENLKVKNLPFSYAVYSSDLLHAVKKYQPYAGIHIFVDTGMHREGVLLRDLPNFLKKAHALHLRIEGLMSHFAMADKPNAKETIQQVTNFMKAQEICANLGIFPKFVHIAATSGILHNDELDTVLTKVGPLTVKGPTLRNNMARVGIGMYGIDPEGKNTTLKPAITLKTKIIQIKSLKKGEKLGYDFTYTATKDMKIAILPIGYNDGVNRKLSRVEPYHARIGFNPYQKGGWVKVGKTFCPIVGRVSMNITIIEISALKANVGDDVIVYSANPKDKNSIQNVAKLCGIIPYEILVGLHASTRRIVV